MAVVDTDQDVVDFNDGVTSLREAIFAANTISGPDTIEFAPSLTAGGPATILLTQGQLVITDDLTIHGPGAGLLTIDAQEQSRIFNFMTGSTGGDFTIEALKLTGGRTTGDNASTGDTTFNGGAVRFWSVGMLTIDDSIITGNRTEGFAADGGAVFSWNGAIIRNSEVTDNHVSGESADGGAVRSLSEMLVSNSTVSSNSASGGRNAGGGLSVGVGGLTLEDSFVSDNHVFGDGGAGGAILSFAFLQVERSTISGNSTTGRYGLGGAAATAHSATFIDSKVADNKTTNDLGGGGGISAGSLQLIDSTVEGNRTEGLGSRGGAIKANTVTLTRSVVQNNQTLGNGSPGGGIYGGTVTSHDTIITGNFTFGNDSPGGGIFGSPVVELYDSSVTNNYTQGSGSEGGGVFSFGTTRLRRSTVDGNYTQGDDSAGGGLYSRLNSDLLDSTVSGNYTMGQRSGGGGLYALQLGRTYLSLYNTTLSGNHTSGQDAAGGAIHAMYDLYASHTTITGNYTTGPESDGGGIWNLAVFMSDSIVAGNSAEDGGDEFGNDNQQLHIAYSLIGSTDGLSANQVFELNDGSGMIIGQDPLLGPLENNGGPTRTHALLTGSPVIDKGSIAGSTQFDTYDQRGEPFVRVYDGDHTGFVLTDMGSVEYQPNPLPGDYNFNGIVDGADYSVWRDTVGATDDFRADGSGPTPGVPDGIVDELDFLFWRDNFGNTLDLGSGVGAAAQTYEAAFSASAPLSDPLPNPLPRGEGTERAATHSVALPVHQVLTTRFPAHPTKLARPRTDRRLASSTARQDAILASWLASHSAATTHAGTSKASLLATLAIDKANHRDADTVDRVFDLLGCEELTALAQR